MKIDVTRRDVLRFGGGAVAGAMLTPAPWKMLDDVAIWTQNWKWIPRPPRGPVSIRKTACALCPAACGVSARCIGKFPVSLHAVGAATLCPRGMTAHHLTWHPKRLRTPLRIANGTQTPADFRSVIEIAKKGVRSSRGIVAVLDMRPDRSVSAAWRMALGSIDGIYIPSPAREGAHVAALERMAGADRGTLAIDTLHARGVLTFGSPAPGSHADSHVILVDPVWSPDVDRVSRWLPAYPGSEAAVANAIAHVLLADGRVPPPQGPGAAEYVARLSRYTPEAVAKSARIDASSIVAAARELAQNQPAVVTIADGVHLGRDAESAVLALNLILGDGGGLVRRNLIPNAIDGAAQSRSGGVTQQTAKTVDLSDVPDHSIAVLFIDASSADHAMPWSFVARKLMPDATVIALSPWAAGTAMNANYIAPVLPPLEALQEIPGRADSPAASLTIAPPLLAPARAAIDPATFINTVFASPLPWSTTDDAMKARALAIHENRRGKFTPLDGEAKPIAQFASAVGLWDAMRAGGRWEDDAATAPPIDAARLDFTDVVAGLETDSGGSGDPRSQALRVVVKTAGDLAGSAVGSPALSKLYQESGLRRSSNTVALNAATARRLALRNGAKARLTTPAGSIEVVVAVDDSTATDVIEAVSGPTAAALGIGRSAANILDIWPAGADGWHSTAVQLVEA